MPLPVGPVQTPATRSEAISISSAVCFARFNTRRRVLTWRITAPKDDPKVAELLRDYHKRNITNKDTLANLLLAEHGIVMS